MLVYEQHLQYFGHSGVSFLQYERAGKFITNDIFWLIYLQTWYQLPCSVL